jgi:hypothetical protein
MKQIMTECQLAVKWAKVQPNGKSTWSWYRVSKWRQWDMIVGHFLKMPDFRFAILYTYNRETETRGEQIGYISRTSNWLKEHQPGKTRKRKRRRNPN